MTGFSRRHPAVCFLFFISAVIFGMIFTHPLLLCVSFFAALLYNLKLTGKKGLGMLLAFILPLIFFAALINGLTAHYGLTVLGTLPGGNSLCLEPIIYGVVAGSSAGAVLLIFSNLNAVVDSDKLLFAVGLKAPKLGLLLSMSLKFVPLYRRRLRELHQGQMGLRVTEKGILGKLKIGARELSALVSIALENSIETADAMKCRGYGLPGRSFYHDYKIRRTDVVLMVLFALCDITIIIGAATGATYALYNPFFQVSDPTPLFFVTLTAYIILCFTPLVTELLEDIKWKKLKSTL